MREAFVHQLLNGEFGMRISHQGECHDGRGHKAVHPADPRPAGWRMTGQIHFFRLENVVPGMRRLLAVKLFKATVECWNRHFFFVPTLFVSAALITTPEGTRNSSR